MLRPALAQAPLPGGPPAAPASADTQTALSPAAHVALLQLSAAPQWAALLPVVQQLVQDMPSERTEELRTAHALLRLAACAPPHHARLLHEMDDAAAAAETPSLAFALLAAHCELPSFAAGAEFDGIGPVSVQGDAVHVQLLECKAAPSKGAPRAAALAAGALPGACATA